MSDRLQPNPASSGAVIPPVRWSAAGRGGCLKWLKATDVESKLFWRWRDLRVSAGTCHGLSTTMPCLKPATGFWSDERRRGQPHADVRADLPATARAISVSLKAVTVDMAFYSFGLPGLGAYCQSQGWDWESVTIPGQSLLVDKNAEERPCSLCSRLRRGQLHAAADRLNCNKIALGQQLDDLCVSFLMALFRGGGLKTMSRTLLLMGAQALDSAFMHDQQGSDSCLGAAAGLSGCEVLPIPGRLAAAWRPLLPGAAARPTGNALSRRAQHHAARPPRCPPGASSRPPLPPSPRRKT